MPHYLWSKHLKEGRYQLPQTSYFGELSKRISLTQLAGYAQSERRAEVLGYLLDRGLVAPLSGPHDYSPYGAACVERARESMDSDKATGKWYRAAIFSPGTAVLGLGAVPEKKGTLMAGAAGPIMIGKSAYFLWSAGVDAEPITVETPLNRDQQKHVDQLTGKEKLEAIRLFRAENFAETIARLANNYGFINIEDAAGRDLPLIFEALDQYEIQSAIWSDDKQGTGVITAAALLSWADLTGRFASDEKPLEGIRVIIFGAGAGSMGVYDELVNNGARPSDILVTDSGENRDYASSIPYPIYENRSDIKNDLYKQRMSEGIDAKTKVEDFAKDVDVILNLGDKRTLSRDFAWTRELIENMAAQPFFGPMTNPDPGLSPEELREIRADAFYGSGNQVYENPVNNFTAFGYIGLGALLAEASFVNDKMTIAAARGIHEVAKKGPPDWLLPQLPSQQKEYGRYWLVPTPLDTRLIEHEAASVALAAADSKISHLLGKNPTPQLRREFNSYVIRKTMFRRQHVEQLRENTGKHGAHYLKSRYPELYAPFHLRGVGYDVVPPVDFDPFTQMAKEMDIQDQAWKIFIKKDSQKLNELCLTEVLTQLRDNYQGESIWDELGRQELHLILKITLIYPALGLALALKRQNIILEDLIMKQTVFHRQEVIRIVHREIPEADSEINELKTWIDKNLDNLKNQIEFLKKNFEKTKKENQTSLQKPSGYRVTS